MTALPPLTVAVSALMACTEIALADTRREVIARELRSQAARMLDQVRGATGIDRPLRAMDLADARFVVAERLHVGYDDADLGNAAREIIREAW